MVNGAGAAAIACTELIKAMGVPHDNVIMCDRKGVIYQGREGLDQWKSAHAVKTDARTLEEALKGADVFLGLSAAGALKPEMVKDMAKQPIIFAMANPDPEITPPDAKAARPDAIVATGRSDYPNQVNNVLGFPFIFRGALDVRATTINDAMKIAAANALAELARQQVPEEVAAAYGGKAHSFGPDYIIPAPFDPRLMEIVPAAVAQAAMDSGRRPAPDRRHGRLSHLAALPAQSDHLGAHASPTRRRAPIRGGCCSPRARRMWCCAPRSPSATAATAFRCWSAATTSTTGCARSESTIRNRSRSITAATTSASRRWPTISTAGCSGAATCTASSSGSSTRTATSSPRLLLAMGEADVMITGVTRPYAQSFRQIRRVLDPQDGVTPFGIHVMVGQSHTVFIADTTVTERPTGEQLAEIAIQTAEVARRMGHEPRVAFLSYSNFGNPEGSFLERIRDAVKIMDEQDGIDFEYEGEMSPDAALNPELQKLYPFMRLTGPANVLVMPGLQTANISAKLLRELGGDAVIGPMLVGMKQQVQIAAMSASASDLVTLAVLAAGRIVR